MGAVQVPLILIQIRSLTFEKVSRCETQYLSRFARIITTPVAIRSVVRKFAARQILPRKLRCRCLHKCIRSADIERFMARETRLDTFLTGLRGVTNVDI